MSKVFMSKRKTVTAVIAVVMCALIIFGGTFAWQSIQQEALNEIRETVNPGGRLHDDFVEITEVGDYDYMTYNKDIYVENYTSRTNNGVDIFARIRLDEYMELGVNAGSTESDNEAKSLIDGASLTNLNTWTTLMWDQVENKPVDSAFTKYWTYTWGNTEGIQYMPTFNLDNTSLDPDVNGAVYFDKDGNRVEVDYTDYAGLFGDAVTEKTDDEVYTPNADGSANAKNGEAKHTTETTGTATVISMKQWINDYNMEPGDYWVYDEDGWAYYADRIDPDFATGLLLTEIRRTEEVINEDWYYGINVVAQFITKEDLGEGTEENPGFMRNGEQPSPNALKLLQTIGVEVTFEANNAEELTEALKVGGTINLNADVTIDTNLVVAADTTLNLNGHTITTSKPIYVNNETDKVWSLISVQGEDTVLTINSGNFKALENDCYAVDVRDGARVVINDGFFEGNITAVYVHSGSALINGGTFAIQQPNATEGETAHAQMINAYDANYANGTADITICGGTFYGFNPTEANDGNFVPTGYTVSENNGVYTVSKMAD